MSDGALMAFGCVVTFIALAGVYTYFLGYYPTAESPSKADAQRAKAD